MQVKQLFNSAFRSLFGITARQVFEKFFNQGVSSPNQNVSEISWIVDWFLNRHTSGCMVDVGAHFGESLAPFAHAGWRVLGFEPDPNDAKWKRLANFLEMENVIIFKCALSDKQSNDVEFYASEESTGVSALSNFLPSHQCIGAVEVKILSDCLMEEGIKEIDFLKIDTEGHDLKVLQGHRWDIRPRVILCEFEDKKTKPLGYDYGDLGDFLIEKGYRVLLSEWHPIVRYGVQHRWRSIREYPTSLQSADGWGNFLALQPEIYDDFIVSSGVAALLDKKNRE